VTEKHIGKRMTRTEDPRLLTGQALFVDDVQIHGMLYATFLRSDYAHARIKSVDVSAARERPGVVAVYTAEDLGDFWQHSPALVPAPQSVEGVVFHTPPTLPLVKENAR
jgi:carbon-monoxide dehydrogenase large subunit